MPFDRVSTSSITPSAEVDNWFTKTPPPKDAEVAIDEVKNTSAAMRSSSSSVIGPGSLNYLLHQKKTSPEEIVNKINHEFSLQPQDPGNALSTILNEFKDGNHVHRANFNALLTFLDNGIQNNNEAAMKLALNLFLGFEKGAHNIKDEHCKKFLSILKNDDIPVYIRFYPKTAKIINSDNPDLIKIHDQREVKITKIKEMLTKISPQSKSWQATPYHFNYKNGLNIESYHFSDENGKVFEATLIVSKDKKDRININNAQEVIGALYQGDREVKVSEIEIPDENSKDQLHVVTLFDRTNLVTLDQYMGDQGKKNKPWSLDSAAVACGNKKEKFIATLDRLQKFHTGLADLHKKGHFGFDSYGYLNPHNILTDQSGTETFFTPAPLLIRDIFKEQHMHGGDNGEAQLLQDPLFDKKFLSPTVREFRKSQGAKEDLYSMAMIWGNTFGLDMCNDIGPFDEAFSKTINGRNKTCEGLKKDLTKKAEITPDDLKKLRSSRNGEKELLDHVERCFKNKDECKASPELITETAAILLSQTKYSYIASAKNWS
ncbi:hypothetical protein PUG81_06980 [Erwiniaceae bacterium L1_54_6]|nr:hypothetical protein [Erwiniaceae bacterium L1_54_6]